MAWFQRPTVNGGGCAFPYLDPAVWPNGTATATSCTSTLGALIREREPRFASAAAVTLAFSAVLLFMHLAEVTYVYWTTRSGRGSRSAPDSKKPLAVQLLRGLVSAVAGVVVAVDPGGLSGVVSPSTLYMVGALLMSCVVSFMCVYGLLLYRVATVLTRVAPLLPVTKLDASTPTVSATNTPISSAASTPTAKDSRGPSRDAFAVDAAAAATSHRPSTPSSLCNRLADRVHATLALHEYVLWPDVVALTTLLPLRALSGVPERYPSALAGYCGLLAVYFGMSVVLTLLPGWVVLRHLRATAALARNSSSLATDVKTVAAIATHADNGAGNGSAATGVEGGGGSMPLVTDAAQLDGSAASSPSSSRRNCGWAIASTLTAVRSWFVAPVKEADKRRRALLWIGAVAIVGAIAGAIGTAIMIRQTVFAVTTGAAPEEFGGSLRSDTGNWQMYIFSNGLMAMWLGVTFQSLSLHRWRWCGALWQVACSQNRSAGCCAPRDSQYAYTGNNSATTPPGDGSQLSGQSRCTVHDSADNRTITIDAATEPVDSHTQLQ